MNANMRTRNLLELLGWQGGTVHDACAEIGVDAHDFLYANAEFGPAGPCADFQRGYSEADDIAVYLAANRGYLQYWFWAISAIQSERDAIEDESR